MKNLALLLLAVFSFTVLHAQQKFDSVYMKNGDINVGAVTAIDDASVKFTYKGETLGYSFKKDDITKIVFASGRVQNIGSPAPPNNASVAVVNNPGVDHHNKVAVLPFSYINTQQETNTEMGYKVQDYCYTVLSGKAAAFNIQDPSTTNASLGKAGVTPDNVRNFTMQELCNILGVEYVVRGTITTNATSTSSSGSATYDQKNQSSTDKNGNNNKSAGSVYSSGSTQQNYQTAVLMEVYADDGKKVFGQDRTSIWQTIDAYKNALQYLLKKTPIYGR